jgi:prolipoprotein diacylglyceryl transferase
MFPQLFHIGGFSQSTYGVLVALAFVAALAIIGRLARRAGLNHDAVLNLAIYCALAAIVGAKIMMFLIDIPYYARNPGEIFSLSSLQAGGVFYGGLIAAIVAAAIYMRRKHLPPLATADVFAPGIALGHGIGRLGCFAAGCCWGVHTSLPWGVTFTNPVAHSLVGVELGVPLHPTQLYESAAEFLIFGILFWRIRKPHAPGAIISLYLVLYATVRFLVEFVRYHDQPNPLGGPLNTSQWISLALLALGAAYWVRAWKRQPVVSSASIVLSLVLFMGLSACGESKKAEGKPYAEAPLTQPALFTVPPEQIAHLRIAPVKTTAWTIAIHTTGTVDWDADHTTQAITQVNGPISRILVDTGSRVAAGDPLLYVASPDFAGAISTYKKARNREDLARRIMQRSQELLDRGAIAAKDFEGTQADFNDAATDVQNSLEALKIYGITPQEIDQAQRQAVPISPELAVRAPLAGEVVQKLVSPGQFIQAATTVCFVLSDVSKVWVQGHIFDRDLPAVHVGDMVEETNPALARTFRGVVSYIGAMVDPATRTTPVRVITENPQGLLKKDMFVDAVIRTTIRKNILIVPVAALLHDSQNEPFVYVEQEPGKFAQRSVKPGAQQDGSIEIVSGISTRDRVVSDGSIFLQFANSFQ